MLELIGLACQRGGRRLFEHLDFAVQPGELVHVQGTNGSGKTSLLRILTGLAAPAAGEVRWRGLDIHAEREAYVGEMLYLGHQPAIKDDLSAQENLVVNSRLSGVHPSREQITIALNAVGLGGRGHLPARVLSQGQRRRLALARLWLDARPLWILDEPFTALDVHATGMLEDRLAQHLAQGGMVVLTTHQPPVVPQASLRVLVMEA